MNVSTDKLRKLLKHSAPSIDEFRFALNVLRIEDGKVVSTDGHRLHVLPEEAANGTTATIPTWAIRAVLDANGSSDRAVKLSALKPDEKPDGGLVETQGIKIEVAGVGYQPFPPTWKQVIPQPVGRCKIQFLKLKVVLSKLRAMVKHGAEVAVISIVGDDLFLAPATGSGRLIGNEVDGEQIPVTRTALIGDLDIAFLTKPGGAIRIGLKLEYLIDALAAAQEYGDRSKTTIVINDALDPVRIDSEDFLAVVMPLRL